MDRTVQENALATTTDATPSDVGDEDWELVSSQDEPLEDTNGASSKYYLDFQLSSIFGNFSFTIGSPSIADNIDDMFRPHQRRVNPQNRSLLFQLPAEIRLRIYEPIFRIPTAEPGLSPTRTPNRRRASSVLAVLLTCRRILAEAESIYYSINRLSAEHPETFASRLGPRRRNAVIMFALPTRSAAALLVQLRQLDCFPNLKSLYILRQESVRYTDVSLWAIMARQLADELKTIKGLVDLKILAPEAINLTEHEKARKLRLEGIDQVLYDAVRVQDPAANSTG